MAKFELTNHSHRRTLLYCDYCDFTSLEDRGMVEHLKTNHIDILEMEEQIVE